MSSGKWWIGNVFSGKLAAHTCACNVYTMLSLNLLKVIRSLTELIVTYRRFFYQNREAYVCVCYR